MPKTEGQEKKDLEECIPKATRNATKWAFRVFSSGGYQGTTMTLHKSLQGRLTAKIQSLDLNIADMNVESLNFWLKRFVQDIVKADGSLYVPRKEFAK